VNLGDFGRMTMISSRESCAGTLTSTRVFSGRLIGMNGMEGSVAIGGFDGHALILPCSGGACHRENRAGNGGKNGNRCWTLINADGKR
jgi:hypothetical protein